MDDTTATTTESTEETGSTETTSTPETGTTEAGKPAETTESSELDELPKWARERLTKANNEAGKYRTSLRDAEARLAAAKSPEDFEKATAELKSANAKLERDLLVERVARTAKLPDELAELLQGSTKEELEAHAKKLQKFVTPAKETPESLRGGLDPNDEDSFDPVKVARAARANRY